jgi:hypothetical protein
MPNRNLRKQLNTHNSGGGIGVENDDTVDTILDSNLAEYSSAILREVACYVHTPQHNGVPVARGCNQFKAWVSRHDPSRIRDPCDNSTSTTNAIWFATGTTIDFVVWLSSEEFEEGLLDLWLSIQPTGG